MPVDPVSRAHLRLVHYRVLRDWFALAREVEATDGRKGEKPRRQLRESIIAANDLASSRFIPSMPGAPLYGLHPELRANLCKLFVGGVE